MADRKSRNNIVAVVAVLFLIGLGLQGKASNPKTTSADVAGAPWASSVDYDAGKSSKEVPYRASAKEASKKTVHRALVRSPMSFVAHDEIWLLTSDTDVLPIESGAIAHVHAGRSIHVIGISRDGAYLQVVLHDRRKGFVVASAAQFKSDWMYDGAK